MNKLEARITKLEEAAGMRDDVLCVIVRRFAGGELCGYCSASYGHESIETIRYPGESEDELLERAKAKTILQNGMILLRELRDEISENDEI